MTVEDNMISERQWQDAYESVSGELNILEDECEHWRGCYERALVDLERAEQEVESCYRQMTALKAALYDSQHLTYQPNYPVETR